MTLTTPLLGVICQPKSKIDTVYRVLNLAVLASAVPEISLAAWNPFSCVVGIKWSDLMLNAAEVSPGRVYVLSMVRRLRLCSSARGLRRPRRKLVQTVAGVVLPLRARLHQSTWFRLWPVRWRRPRLCVPGIGPCGLDPRPCVNDDDASKQKVGHVTLTTTPYLNVICRPYAGT